MARAGELLIETLSAWNEADREARAAILEKALSASFVYEDPHAPAPFEGRDGLGEYLTIFLDSLPDAALLPQGSPQVTHDTAMVQARLDRAGTPFARLVFVGVAGEDGLTRLTGFVDSE